MFPPPHVFGTVKLKAPGYRANMQYCMHNDMSSCFDTPVCERQTDRQTDRQGLRTCRASIALYGNNNNNNNNKSICIAPWRMKLQRL